MRLLKCDHDGKFSLTKDLTSNIPLYAILSHTWGPDTEEVTFQDLVSGVGGEKAGYEKLRFCANQAHRHGLLYFWVDTCCIDKTNNAELSEAINSMFRWYHDAARCYVYLADVATATSPWESAFRSSRWFTRGWTLQELLAPKFVEFFARDGTLLGDKTSLLQQINEITGIAVPALHGDLLTRDVEERFKWAEGRQTTREEDWAYSLLGIFGVFIPLIYGEGKANAGRRLRKEIDDAQRREKVPRDQEGNCAHFATVSSPLTPHEENRPWIVPFERNRCFTGREAELARLQDTVSESDQTGRVAIVGLGGVGKTQLALELAYRTRSKHNNCSVLWIPAANQESLDQAYHSAAKQLRIPGWAEDKLDAKKLVQDHLSSREAGQWLLIFDNADDIDMWMGKSQPESSRLIDHLPRSNLGTIVFTTRDKRAAVKLANQNIISVPEMDEDAAKHLLQKCLINQSLADCRNDDVVALLAQLTHLPLAIIQAAAYINENGITLAQYLSLLTEQEEDVIDLLSEEFEDHGTYSGAKNPVATTWLISFEQIRQRNPLATDCLSLMGCVEPKDIPKSLLPPGQSRKKETDAIGILKAYSFIVESIDRGFAMHRLVHLATRNWLRKEGSLLTWTNKVIQRLLAVFQDARYHNKGVWRPYMPHTRYILESGYVGKNTDEETSLRWRYGICLQYEGRYHEAEAPIRQVLEARKNELGLEHSDTLSSMEKLSAILLSQGQWKETELLDVQVLETRKKVLGLEDPSTLKSMSNLAATYRSQGRWKESESLAVQAMETRKRVLGLEHPHTLSSIGNLTTLYRDQGRWKEAELYSVQVLDTRKRVLGLEHPSTLFSMVDLGGTYRNLGRLQEAESLEAQAMEVMKRLLGPEHPDTLTSMLNLSATYRDQGRLEESELLLVQTTETMKRVLGPEHPHTLTAIAHLAIGRGKQGRWRDAELLEAQVLEARKRRLGLEHPDTLTTMANLAFSWERQGRLDEALSLMAQCVELRSRIIGPDHPYIKSSRSMLRKWQESAGGPVDTTESSEAS
jgi:tetratricopeptide (TPR) repeat protein